MTVKMAKEILAMADGTANSEMALDELALQQNLNTVEIERKKSSGTTKKGEKNSKVN